MYERGYLKGGESDGCSCACHCCCAVSCPAGKEYTELDRQAHLDTTLNDPAVLALKEKMLRKVSYGWLWLLLLGERWHGRKRETDDPAPILLHCAVAAVCIQQQKQEKEKVQIISKKVWRFFFLSLSVHLHIQHPIPFLMIMTPSLVFLCPAEIQGAQEEAAGRAGAAGRGGCGGGRCDEREGAPLLLLPAGKVAFESDAKDQSELAK